MIYKHEKLDINQLFSRVLIYKRFLKFRDFSQIVEINRKMKK